MSHALEIESEVPELMLGSGSMGAFNWAVFAGRDGESGSPRYPCITLAMDDGVENNEGTSTARTCASLDADPPRFVPRLIISSGAGEETRTVLGLAFPSHVRSVRLWLDNRGSKRISLRRLNPEQAAFAGLSRFRYAAEGIEGPFCLRRLATYDASGDVLEMGLRQDCS
ncbi:MAG TPA: hypothetical protein VMS60_00250 [Solirubrobacterales bacterium]|nr:hypothetical protein [Solirubrobacterales bacterium]